MTIFKKNQERADKTLKKILIAIMVILALPLAAQAYYSQDIGNRVTAQLITNAEWGIPPPVGLGFKIAWEITQETLSSPFHYQYTLSGGGGGALSRNLSHWILEVSADAVMGDFSNFTPPYSNPPVYGVATWTPSQGNQGMPANIYWDNSRFFHYYS